MEMQAEAMGLGGNYHALRPETKYYLPNALPANFTQQEQFSTFGFNLDEINTRTGDTTVAGEAAYSFETKQGFVRPYYHPAEYDYAYNKGICSGESDDDWSEMVNGRRIVRLSCSAGNDRLWDVIDANTYDMKKFMSFITIVAVITYFVTSSDSGSMVVDMLCSNGLQEPPVLQRIFWSCAEGAVAFSLLEAGGSNALSALQTASIAAGLPFCVIMIGMMIATYQMFTDMELDDPEFLKTQEAEMKA
eukprot:TRINITY_DN3434_c0_g1_i1.p1 TRINITY_DN3434_c0_g1~~TRINITY_DN3434_c0_g1_i1.p1  ORF type:complete len:283 (-),score=61.51 TRINITY_DN3434_c0_g1_i1:68-808(-)